MRSDNRGNNNDRDVEKNIRKIKKTVNEIKKERYKDMTPKEKKDAMDKDKVRMAVVLILLVLASCVFYGINFIKTIFAPSHQEELTAETNRPKIYTGYNEDYTEDYTQDGVVRHGTVETGNFQYSKIPEFDGSTPYYVLNHNTPYFDTSKLDETKPEDIRSYEKYTDLDELGRVGICESIVGTDLMPKEKRGPIGHVRPTGWRQARYDDLIRDKYLYNRCHLIGFQLTGENDNKKNLMTGTRFFNVEGMLPFENEVTNYIKRTENHVKYKMTPVFLDNDLVARGLIMEAYSIEDKGKGVCFNVFVYNNQPGIDIDYKDGSSKRLKK